MTDSELVPWGKGEKNPDKGSEIDLKPYTYKESERAALCVWIFRTLSAVRHGVPIEEWANEFIYAAG